MSKVLRLAPFILRQAGRFFRSQFILDVSALWAVVTFVLGTIYFSQLAGALVLMSRAAQ